MPAMPTGVEYVPMSWGYYGGDETSTVGWVNWLQSLGAKELLAFNEPDNSSQSNLTVQSALQGYTYLSAGNLPVISPAGMDDGDSWMKTFMSDSASKGLNVPAVAVHAYQGTAASFLNYIDWIHNLYGKPLWITEFAPTDWQSPTGVSATDCIHYINTVLPALQSRDYVARYSWYCGTQPGTGVLETAALFNPDNTLTAVGMTYANPAQPSPLPNGTYEIVNRNSGKALTVLNNLTANQSAVGQSTFTGGQNQMWTLTDLGNGLYKIVGLGSGRSLDVYGDAIPNGSTVDIFDYYNIDCMTWYIQQSSPGYYCIIGVGGGKALDVYNNATTDGAIVDMWSYHAGNNQQWQLITNPAPAITSIAPNGVLVGSGAFTLTVNGNNFVSSSTVDWDGAALTTTFVSATQLTASVPAADIASAGTHSITVVTPVPGGGTSNAVSEEADSACALTSISPTSAPAGSAALTLTVTGSGFINGAVVSWAGTPLPTTYVSATELTATISADLLSNAGQFAVTVSNPVSGSGSGSALFKVTGVAHFIGLVTRSFDGAPVGGVTITLTDSAMNKYSSQTSRALSTGSDNARVNYTIDQLPGGTYNLTVTASGYTLPTLPSTITIPNTGAVRQDIVLGPMHVYAPGLQMISAPDDYGAATPSDLLYGLGSGLLATWDAGNATYALSPQAPADRMSRGRAYWVRATTSLDLYGANTPADSSIPFVIPVTAGWNMIADPFDVSVNLSDLRSGTVASPNRADQLIFMVMYRYDGATNAYVTSGPTLAPYAGYWVYALHDGNLIVYAPGT
jgi:hypothetical protein